MKHSKTGTMRFLLRLTLLLSLSTWAHSRAVKGEALDITTPKLIIPRDWHCKEVSLAKEPTNPMSGDYSKNIGIYLDLAVETDRTKVVPANVPAFDQVNTFTVIEAKQTYLQPASPYNFSYQFNDGKQVEVEENKQYALAPENTYRLVKRKREGDSKRRIPLPNSSNNVNSG